MKEKLVRDILVPLEEYPCVPDTHTLRQAIEEMGKVQILRKKQASLPRTALVFDESFSDLLGKLRRRDIMRGLEPEFLVTGSLEYRASAMIRFLPARSITPTMDITWLQSIFTYS